MRKIAVVLFVTVLSNVTVASILAQERTIGVVVGNWFRYSVDFRWNSTDPDAVFPPVGKEYLAEVNETEWILLSIQNVYSPLVDLHMVKHLRNGTERVDVGHVDIATGLGNMSCSVISANLSVNDLVYTHAEFSGWRINETVTRDYENSSRETNHLNITIDYSSLFGHTFYDVIEYYWDRATGAMVECTRKEVNQTELYLTTWSETQEIIESNVWVVPEMPNAASVLLALFTLTVTATICQKRFAKHRSDSLLPDRKS